MMVVHHFRLIDLVFFHLDFHYDARIKNVGPRLARQYCIDHGKGRYIIFIDADDQLFYGTVL